ncbi:MAG: hypothetical protein AB7P99_04680 [Vicinamibacterales bacterium]
MGDVTELDELESGVTSGFWQRFRAHAAKEWGPEGKTFKQLYRRALQGNLGTEAETVHRLKVLEGQRAAIEELLAWPTERLAEIKGQVQRAGRSGGPSRRGSL